MHPRLLSSRTTSAADPRRLCVFIYGPALMRLEGLLFHIFEWVLQAVHSMCLDHINPPTSQLRVFFFLFKPIMYSSCCLCILDVWPFTEVELTRQGPHYWHLPLDNGVSPGVGLCDYLLSPVQGFCVAWPCADFGRAVTATVSSRVYVPCCVWRTRFPCSHPLPLAPIILRPFPLGCSPSLRGRGCHRDVPSSAHHKTSLEMEIDTEGTHDWGRHGEWGLWSAHPKQDNTSLYSFWSLLPSHFLSFLVFPLPLPHSP